MDIELKELSMKDGIDVFIMIKEIGPGENGFGNSGYDMNQEVFPEYLLNNFNMSKGLNLSAQHVPQTLYWLYIDGVPVGIGKLRDYLNDNLRKVGGHIGYSIRPTERGKGYGKIMLQELLVKASEKNILQVLLTCNENNIPSRKIIESNSGKLQDIIEAKCRYWIRLD